MQIPTRKECYRLIHEMEMRDNIIAHSLQVCRVALFLTDQLLVRDIILERELIRAAALLHDITKTRSLSTREVHSDTGAELLTERGYPEVADIVRQHVRLDRYPPAASLTEAEIVNYADKRVLHDCIAPLDDRIGYILERYGSSREIRDRIRETWNATIELEQKIFACLTFSPDDLPDLLPGLCEMDLHTYREVIHTVRIDE